MTGKPRIAVLIDLPREAASGGHVKYWERLAQTAATMDAPVDLTFYFSGEGPNEILSPDVRYRYLPPLFSTARLKFLPYIPAHTDLAPFHPQLAQELAGYDVIHTTDAFFAFARTAERAARWHGIPLMTSLHTDTPAYAELFTRQTLHSLFGTKIGDWFDGGLKISRRERLSKRNRLKRHMRHCAVVMAMRGEDVALAQSAVEYDKIKSFRLAVDKKIFTPQPAARAVIEQDYKIPAGKFLVLFVGRVDAGKNVPLLIKACDAVIKNGVPLHLLVAGLGPMSDEVKTVLGDNVTLAGMVPSERLAQFYAAADCLAIASDIEIGGMIGLEALACGCPVLVSEKSDIAQLVGNPPAMQKIESTHEAWVKALTGFACDPRRQATMHAAALDFRENTLAGWADILNADFIPVWQDLARHKGA